MHREANSIGPSPTTLVWNHLALIQSTAPPSAGVGTWACGGRAGRVIGGKAAHPDNAVFLHVFRHRVHSIDPVDTRSSNRLDLQPSH